MSKINLSFCLLAFLILLGACKKDSTPVASNTNSPLGSNSPTIPNGAAGALYAVNTNIIGGGGSTTTAYAWFGSYTTTQNAGVVLCAGDTLSTAIPFTNVAYPWYELSIATLINGGSLPDFTSTNNVQWNVSGSNSVPAINYNDQTVWPQVTNFNPAATVSLSASFTYTFTISGSSNQVICSIQGSKSTVSQTASGGSVTFTAAQLSSAAVVGDNLAVQVMPVEYTSQSISGKTYYFVKQNGFTGYATVTQ